VSQLGIDIHATAGKIGFCSYWTGNQCRCPCGCTAMPIGQLIYFTVQAMSPRWPQPQRKTP
jgi:hypothetical protein